MTQNNIFLYQMLRRLSREEYKQLLTFAASPFFKTSTKCYTYLKLLFKHHPNLDEYNIEKDNNVRKIYSGLDRSEKMNKLRSATKHLLEKFLVIKEIEAQSKINQLLLLDVLLHRNIDASVWRKAYASIPVNAIMERHTAYVNYQMSSYELLCLEREKVQTEDYAKFFDKQLLPDLNRLLIQEKLRLGCQLLLIQSQLKNPDQHPLFKEIDFLVPLYQDVINNTPVLQAFCRIFNMMRSGTTEQQLQAFEYWFDDSIQEKIPNSEYRDLMILLINLQAAMMEQGAYNTLFELQGFYRRQFDLYQKLDRLDLLFEGQFIPHQRFKNAVSVAVNSDNFDWVEAFIQRNITHIAPTHREALRCFSEGALAFYRGDFMAAGAFFNRPQTPNDFYFFDIHTMRVRMLVEQDNTLPNEEQDGKEKMQMWYAQIKNKMKDNHLAKEQVEKYDNFFKFAKALYHIKNSHTLKRVSSLNSLKEDIIQAPCTYQKKWLLEKIEKLLKHD